MARKGRYDCADVSDPLGACRDFTPSYPVGRTAARGPLMDRLLTSMREYLGLSPGKVLPETPLREVPGLEADDINAVREGTGLPPIRDPSGLFAQGTISDLLPSVEALGHLAQKRYLERVQACNRLEGDERAFRAAGCKRRAHVRLPGGRTSLGGADPYEGQEVSKDTEERWQRRLPPLDARTQSPAVRQARDLPALTSRIWQGILRFTHTSGQVGETEVRLPSDPGPLAAAGVPTAAAELLVHALGGRRVRLLRGAPESVPDALVAVLGGHPLQMREGSDKLYLRLDTEGVDLRSLRGPMRVLSAFLAEYKYRPRGQRSSSTHRKLRVAPFITLEAARMEGGARPGPIPVEDGLTGFYRGVESRARGDGWTLVLTFGRPGSQIGVREVRLQHSVLMGPKGSLTRPDYTTLRGFSLQELAPILARKALFPRKKRRGRRKPHRAKQNPVATYTIPADLKLQPGQYVPYEVGAKVVAGDPDASSGKFVYLSKKPGSTPRVVTARRLATWLGVAQYGQLIHAAAQRRAATPSAEPNPSRRSLPMGRSKKNPRYPAYSRTSLPKRKYAKLTDYYYPGSLWDWYETGDYSTATETVPVNRRNPAKPKKKRKPRRKGEELANWKKGLHRRSSHRNKRTALISKLAKGRSKEERKAIFAMSTTELEGFAAANPRWRHKHFRKVKRPYWPRKTMYEQAVGPFGAGTPLPPNRRNPRGKKNSVMIGRFPQDCPACGHSMKGEQIVDSGMRGPRGGKKMVHLGCL